MRLAHSQACQSYPISSLGGSTPFSVSLWPLPLLLRCEHTPNIFSSSSVPFSKSHLPNHHSHIRPFLITAYFLQVKPTLNPGWPCTTPARNALGIFARPTRTALSLPVARIRSLVSSRSTSFRIHPPNHPNWCTPPRRPLLPPALSVSSLSLPFQARYLAFVRRLLCCCTLTFQSRFIFKQLFPARRVSFLLFSPRSAKQLQSPLIAPSAIHPLCIHLLSPSSSDTLLLPYHTSHIPTVCCVVSLTEIPAFPLLRFPQTFTLQASNIASTTSFQLTSTTRLLINVTWPNNLYSRP